MCLYQYCKANPINYLDPYGWQAKEERKYDCPETGRDLIPKEGYSREPYSPGLTAGDLMGGASVSVEWISKNNKLYETWHWLVRQLSQDPHQLSLLVEFGGPASEKFREWVEENEKEVKYDEHIEKWRKEHPVTPEEEAQNRPLREIYRTELVWFELKSFAYMIANFVPIPVGKGFAVGARIATRRAVAESLARLAAKEGKVVGVRITGYTWHGLLRVMGRDGVGVSPKAILDALRNPLEVIKTRKEIKYVGKYAVVVLNKGKKLVTAWARSRGGLRIPGPK